MAESAPVQLNLYLEQGATYEFATHSNLDLSEYQLEMHIRRSFTSTSPTVTLTEASGIAKVVAGNHTDITITIPASAFSSVAMPWHGVYDLEARLGGVTYRLRSGGVRVEPNATYS